jgi:hypothetical protein
MQDVEMLKAHLAQLKIHIPTQALQRGIIMPRDEDIHGDYPKLLDFLQHDPFPKDRSTAKKKKAAKKKGGAAAAKNADEDPTKYKPLVANEKFQYKPFEYGNYPLQKDGKPRGGYWKLSLPADADWTPRPKKLTEEEKKEKEA